MSSSTKDPGSSSSSSRSRGSSLPRSCWRSTALGLPACKACSRSLSSCSRRSSIGCATGGTGGLAPPSPWTSGSSTATGVSVVSRPLLAAGLVRPIAVPFFLGGQARPEPGWDEGDHGADHREQAADDDQVRADRDEVADAPPELGVVDDAAYLVHVQEARHDHGDAEHQAGDLPPRRERHHDDEQPQDEQDHPETDAGTAGTGVRVDDELGRDRVRGPRGAELPRLGAPVHPARKGGEHAADHDQDAADARATWRPCRCRGRGGHGYPCGCAPQGARLKGGYRSVTSRNAYAVTRKLQRMTTTTAARSRKNSTMKGGIARNHFTRGSHRFSSFGASGYTISTWTACSSSTDGYSSRNRKMYEVMRVSSRTSIRLKSNHHRGYLCRSTSNATTGRTSRSDTPPSGCPPNPGRPSPNSASSNNNGIA